eukprot:PhF_6_TR11023/c0_g1_i2/m.17854
MFRKFNVKLCHQGTYHLSIPLLSKFQPWSQEPTPNQTATPPTDSIPNPTENNNSFAVCETHRRLRAKNLMRITPSTFGGTGWACTANHPCHVNPRKDDTPSISTQPPPSTPKRRPPGPKSKNFVTCSLHNLRRAKDYMEYDKEAQTWRCTPSSVCVHRIFCIVHGQRREKVDMYEVEPGIYRCKPMASCEGQTPRPVMPSDEKSIDIQVCSLHGRKRKTSCMVFNEEQQAWVCKKGTECQNIYLSSEKRKMEHPSKRIGWALCARHQVLYRPTSSMDQTIEGWVCRDTDPCRMKEFGVCATHGVRRYTNNLVQDAEGVWRCKENRVCGSYERKIPVCFTCKQSGHLSHDCPKKICHQCGLVGHIASECPDNIVL